MVYLHASVAVNEVDGNFLRSLIDQNERLMPGPLFCLVFFLSTRRVRIKINWLLLSISLPCKRIFLRHIRKRKGVVKSLSDNKLDFDFNNEVLVDSVDPLSFASSWPSLLERLELLSQAVMLIG